MYDHFHSFVDFALSGCIASWAETMEEDLIFQCKGCRKVTTELAGLTGIVKRKEMRIIKETDGTESGDRETGRKQQCSDKKDVERREGECKENRWRKNNRKHDMQEGDGEKVTVDEGRTMGQERREVHVTGGMMKGRKEVRVDVSKGKLITGMVTGRKEAGKKVMGGRGATYRNCKNMAINALIEQMCEEERVGFVYLWGYFVGKEDMYVRDGLHLSGKGAAVLKKRETVKEETLIEGSP